MRIDRSLALLRLRAAASAALVLLGVALNTGPASARDPDPNDHPVDFAVDVFVRVGWVFGVSIEATEGRIIKAIVHCAIDNRPVGNCAQREVLLLLELPPAAAGLLNCVLSGNENALKQCATDQAIQSLPQEAGAVVACIRDRGDFGNKCSGNGAVKQALAVIDKLQADGRSPLVASKSGTIRNIIATSQGIRDREWVKVLESAGPEVYKIAAKAVVHAIMTPLLAGEPTHVISDAADAIVQHRVDLVTNITRDTANGDVRAVGHSIVEGYLTANFVVPCTLSIIPEEVRQVFCGPAGQVIRKIAQIGGSVVNAVASVIKDVLGVVWDVFEGLLGTFAGKDTNCGPPAQWYANSYAKCYHRAVGNPQQLSGLMDSLNNICRNEYARCFRDVNNNLSNLCEPQKATFRTHVNELAAAVNRGAALYGAGFDGFVRTVRDRACGDQMEFMRREYNPFLDRCAQALAVQFPLTGDPNSSQCWTAPMTMFRTAHKMACEQALKRRDAEAILARICRPPTVRPGALLACKPNVPGTCGSVDIVCQRPLPAGAEFSVTGKSGVSVTRFVIETGLITGTYSLQLRPHTYTGTTVCARNSAGVACSAPFDMTLGATNDPICFNTPIPRPCAEGQSLCIGPPRFCSATGCPDEQR